MYQYHMSVPLARTRAGFICAYTPDLEPNGSIAITGQSGSGKTRTLTRLIQALRPTYPVIVLSPHEDLADTLGGGVPVTEDGIIGYSVNPIAMSSASVSRYGATGAVGRVIEMLERAGSKFGAQQRAMLFDILKQDADSVARRDPLDPPRRNMTLEVLVSLLQDVAANADSAGRRSVADSLLARLKPLSSMRLFTLDNELDIARLVQHGGVFDISRIRGSARALFCEILLGLITDYVFFLGVIRPGNPRHRAFLFIDEAKTILGGNGKNDPDHPVNVLATEGRKFGVSLIMASQRIEHLSEDFISNAAVQMVLGPVTDARERKKLGSVYGLGSAAIKSLSFAGSVYIASSTVPGEVCQAFS